MRNRWRDVKIDISLRGIISLIPLLGGLFFILYLRTIPAIIFGFFFICIFLSIFVVNLISYKNYWNINAYINDFASITWSKPALSNEKKYNILMDFFNEKNINYKSVQNKKDHTNLKCYKTYYINGMNLFIGITKWGFLLYSEKKDNKSLNFMKNNLSNYINSLNF